MHISTLGPPWSCFSYHLHSQSTAAQQKLWYFLERPKAEFFWPNADILYCTAESYVPTRQARSVVTIHDAAYFDFGAHDRNVSFYIQHAKWRLLFGKMARKADRICTVSQFSAERIGYHFPHMKSRLCVVPNGVESLFFEDAIESIGALSRLGLSNRRYILVPGGLSYRKNAELIISAWPKISVQLPDCALVVTSHVELSYATKLRRNGKRVITTGYVDDESLRELYRNATVVWFPSRYEGFGLPVLEAMASGAPVVTSAAASLPEVAGDAAIMLPVNSAPAHVDAIIDLVNSDRERAMLAKRGRARAQIFTWERSAEVLRSALVELV